MIPKLRGNNFFRLDTEIWSGVTSTMQTIALQQSPTGDTLSVILYQMFLKKTMLFSLMHNNFLPPHQ